MLKKMLFVGALLLVTSASYAALPPSGSFNGVDVEEWDGHNNIKGESWSWPAQYLYQPVCVIPVKMDVGFWVRIVGCKDAVLKLRQDQIRKYSGSIELTVQCNVSIDLKVDFAKLGDLPFNLDSASITPNHLDPKEGKVTVSVKLKDVNMANWASEAVGTCIQVGTVTVSVRPSVAPQLAGAC
jgi:hypothetical protein